MLLAVTRIRLLSNRIQKRWHRPRQSQADAPPTYLILWSSCQVNRVTCSAPVNYTDSTRTRDNFTYSTTVSEISAVVPHAAPCVDPFTCSSYDLRLTFLSTSVHPILGDLS